MAAASPVAERGLQGFRAPGLSCSRVVEHRPSCFEACGIPEPGVEPVFPPIHWQADSSHWTTGEVLDIHFHFSWLYA